MRGAEAIQKQKVVEQLTAVRRSTNAELRKLILEENRIDILAALLGYDIAPFHFKILSFKMGLDFGNRWRRSTLIIGPRGFGKSTAMNVVLNTWRILKNPNIRILLCSKSEGKAKAFLHEIKACLTNPRVIEIFGNQKGDKWEESSIIVAGRTVVRKEPTVSTTGLDSQVASGHYDSITADDMIDEKNTITPHLREVSKTFFYKSLLPTLEPHGEIDVLGTRYHFDDLYNWLMKQDSDFSTSTLIVSCFDENGESIYPEKFSTEFLLRKKRNMGSIIFESQYEGKTDKMTGKIFNWDSFTWIENAPTPTGMRVFQGVDLAISQSDSSADFAHCTVFHDKENFKYYVVDCWKGKLTFLQQTKLIVEKFEQFDPVRVGIEANGYQAAKYQELRDSRNERERAVRARPMQTSKDKEARAWKLTAEFERGDIIFVRGAVDALAYALIEMPESGKDLFDALDIALRTSKMGQKKQRTSESGVI